MILWSYLVEHKEKFIHLSLLTFSVYIFDSLIFLWYSGSNLAIMWFISNGENIVPYLGL